MRPTDGKKGGARGNSGHTFTLTNHPDEVIRHEVKACSHCSASLLGVPVQSRIKASDFEFAWKRLLAPDTASQAAPPAYIIQWAEACNSGKGSADDAKIKAKDDKTLAVSLNERPPGCSAWSPTRPI